MLTLQTLALICSVAMPLFNIPLILHIIRQKNSDNISLSWVVGVWVCILGMFPAGVLSPDLVMRVFSVVNLAFFTGVFVTVVYFHPKTKKLFRKSELSSKL